MCLKSRRSEVKKLPFDDKEGYLQSITDTNMREEIEKLIDGNEDNIDFTEMSIRTAVRSGAL